MAWRFYGFHHIFIGITNYPALNMLFERKQDKVEFGRSTNITYFFATKARDIIFLDISRRKNFDFVCFMAIVQLYRYNVWFSIIKNTFIIKSEFILNY